MYEVVFTKDFKKELKKASKNNIALHKKIGKTLHFLSTNVNHPSLKLHKLKGLEYWSVFIDQGHRIKIKITDRYVFCLKFGTHKEVY
jgi:mRNA-degrading endonuclease YafQ of YafQ-DinJ toxin-antitoxin module